MMVDARYARFPQIFSSYTLAEIHRSDVLLLENYC